MDISIADTSTTSIGQSALRRLVRQLNAFGPSDLLLNRFQVYSPHHRRQGGAVPAAAGSTPGAMRNCLFAHWWRAGSC